MKKLTLLAAFAVASITSSFAQQAAVSTTSHFTITTPAFPDGTVIPIKYSQAAPGALPGTGTSPELIFSHVPKGTLSFIVHFHDLDESKNKTTDDQVHWLVWNIPGTVTGIAEGQPKGAQLPNGASQVSATGMVYRGPGAEADGPLHHYTFELYALDIAKVDVQPMASELETRKKVMQAIQGHVVGKAAYGGLFRRPN